MKIIGRGWQYTVYDKGDGRVLKRYNTWLEAYVVMLKDAFRHLRPPVLRFSRYYYEGRETALRSLRVISQNPLEKWMFGNPKIIDAYTYEQDYAVSLSSSLAKVSPEEGKHLIDMAVAFCLILFGCSFIEKNFNVGDNFGLNSSGQVILLDLGEIYSSQPEIEEQIKNRVWAAPDILSRFPAHLRTYFLERMDETFSAIRNT